MERIVESVMRTVPSGRKPEGVGRQSRNIRQSRPLLWAAARGALQAPRHHEPYPTVLNACRQNTSAPARMQRCCLPRALQHWLHECCCPMSVRRGADRVGRGLLPMVSTRRVMMMGFPRMLLLAIMDCTAVAASVSQPPAPSLQSRRPALQMLQALRREHSRASNVDGTTHLLDEGHLLRDLPSTPWVTIELRSEVKHHSAAVCVCRPKTTTGCERQQRCRATTDCRSCASTVGCAIRQTMGRNTPHQGPGCRGT